MESKMKLSVIMCVYNTPREILLPSLESVASQRCNHPYEFIIVDDGSNDDTHKILEQFTSENSYAKLCTQTNEGIASARNSGLKNSSGNLVYWIDSDDLLKPNAFQVIIDKFNQYPDIAFLSFGWTELRKRRKIEWKVTKKERIIDTHEILYSLCGDFLFKGYVWNKVFNLDVTGRDIQGFDTSFKVFEDKIWMLELGSRLTKALLIPDSLYIYKFNPGSITRDMKSLRARQFKYYEANERIVSMAKQFGDDIYYAALEYYFSLAINDYFYWLFMSKDRKNELKKNRNAVEKIIERLEYKRIKSRYLSFLYRTFRVINR